MITEKKATVGHKIFKIFADFRVLFQDNETD